MAEGAGTHRAVRHDGSLVHVAHVAVEAGFGGCSILVIFGIVQFWGGT